MFDLGARGGVLVWAQRKPQAYSKISRVPVPPWGKTVNPDSKTK